jgi:hypothetical protein
MHNVIERIGPMALASAIMVGLFIAVDAEAYVDPGTTGLLSQMLYILFYAALGLFFYSLRYIKQMFANGRKYLARLLVRADEGPDSTQKR